MSVYLTGLLINPKLRGKFITVYTSTSHTHAGVVTQASDSEHLALDYNGRIILIEITSISAVNFPADMDFI